MFKRFLSSIFLTFCLWLIAFFSYPHHYDFLLHKANHIVFSMMNIR